MSVTEIPAGTLAAQQLREAMAAGPVHRSTIQEIADATALEPHEVIAIAKRIREEGPPKRIPHPSTQGPRAVPTGPATSVSREAVAANVPAAAESDTPLSVAREAFAAFTAHDVRAIANKALKITALADELIELVEADTRDARKRDELARLEAKAAKLRQELGLKPPPGKRTMTRGEFPCPPDSRVLSSLGFGRGSPQDGRQDQDWRLDVWGDLRLLGCWRGIQAHLTADVSDQVKLSRITETVKTWRNELHTQELL